MHLYCSEISNYVSILKENVFSLRKCTFFVNVNAQKQKYDLSTESESALYAVVFTHTRIRIMM